VTLRPDSTVKIRITRAVQIVDEIPYNNTYYPQVPTAADAVQVELTRDINHKLEEFARVLESTPAEKLRMREKIEIVVQCACAEPVADPSENECVCWHPMECHNAKTGQCSVFEPVGNPHEV